MNNVLLLLILLKLSGTLAYDGCHGSVVSYMGSGQLEEWRCNGTCISVNTTCSGQCYKGGGYGNTFHLWKKSGVCVRKEHWYFCDNVQTEALPLPPVAPAAPFSQPTHQPLPTPLPTTSTQPKQYENCEAGTAGCQPMHIPCGGECIRSGPTGDWWKSTGDWWKCRTVNQCVLGINVCNGRGPYCRDGSDQSISTCGSNQTSKTKDSSVQNLPGAYNGKCTTGIIGTSRPTRCTGRRPHQCVLDAEGRDCLDKSDGGTQIEAMLDGTDQDTLKDIATDTTVTSCTNSWGLTGLQCLDRCLSREYWCRPSLGAVRTREGECQLKVANTTVRIADPGQLHSLCYNKKFWDRFACKDGYSRCGGVNPGQCIYNPDGKMCLEQSLIESCEDFSLRVCSKAATYKDISGTRISGEAVCRKDEDMWMCSDNTTCVHKRLLCDGTPQCPDGSDENNSTMCSCPWNLGDDKGPNLLKNRNNSAASMKCLDIRLPGSNISTCAVRCDGKKECRYGEDEAGCTENKILFWISTGLVVVIFVTASILLVHKFGPAMHRKLTSTQFPVATEVDLLEMGPASTHAASKKMIQLICKPEQDVTKYDEVEMLKTMNILHVDNQFAEKMQIVATSVQIDKNISEIERRNQLLSDLEVKLHGGVGHEICMKNNYGTNTVTKAVIKGKKPGILDKIVTFVGSYLCCWVTHQGVFKMTTWFSTKKTIRILAAIAEMTFYYVDLLKDLGVVFVIFQISSTTTLSYTVFFLTFNGQILLLMIFSTVSAILITSAFLSANHEGQELQILGVKRKSFLILLRLLTFVLSVLVPTTLIYQLTRQKITLKVMEEAIADKFMTSPDEVDTTAIKELMDQKEKVNKLSYLAYFRQKIDLAFEVTIQTTITVIMILVVRSVAESLTETGLQAIFDDETALLVISFVMAFKKVITANLAIISAQKNGFLPMTGKCIKALSFLLASLLRIGAIVLYFGLPIGVLDILVHKNSLFAYNTESRSMIYDVKGAPGNLTLIRINDTYTVTEYTQFTGMRLRGYGISFFVGVIIHIILVSVVKRVFFNEGFSQLSGMEQFLHIVHCIGFPESSADWDFGNTGSLETYKHQWEMFKNEEMFMLIVHSFENILLTIPVLYICTNVVNYHQTLPYTTRDEDRAYSTAWKLRIIWPAVVLISPFLQWLLLMLYNLYGHPWASIIELFDNETNQVTDVENQVEDIPFDKPNKATDVEDQVEHIPVAKSNKAGYVEKQVEDIPFDTEAKSENKVKQDEKLEHDEMGSLLVNVEDLSSNTD